MAAKLSPISAGVVHSTAYRTRIKLPKDQRSEDNAIAIKDALLVVPGVKDVQLQLGSGNLVIEHDERADVIENIGEALREVSPQLVNKLTAGTSNSVGTGIGLKGLATLGTFFNGILSDDSSAKDKPAVSKQEMGRKIKRAIPWAFAAAGLMQLLEGEALLAGISPLVLLYWAFDTHWKFKEEAVVDSIQKSEAAKYDSQ